MEVPPPGAGRDEGDDPLGAGLDPAALLPRRIRYWADHRPDAPFLVEVGGRRLTYAETWLGIGRWCGLLGELGVRRGDRVASFLPPSVDASLLWLATACLGAFEVPINPALPAAAIEHVLSDSGATVGFARPGAVPQHGAVVVPADGSFVDGGQPVTLDELPGPEDVACVIYTSGTTGPVKGVVVRWAQLSAILGRIPRSWFEPDDAVYACWPMFHVTGRTPLLVMGDVGGRVVLRERFSLPDFWSDVRAHGCTHATTANVMALLLGEAERPDDADTPLQVVFGSSSPDLNDRFAARFGVEVVQSYGSTEVGFPLVNRDLTGEHRAVTGWLRPGYEATGRSTATWARCGSARPTAY